jgi:hypothetical protein
MTPVEVNKRLRSKDCSSRRESFNNLIIKREKNKKWPNYLTVSGVLLKEEQKEELLFRQDKQ